MTISHCKLINHCQQQRFLCQISSILKCLSFLVYPQNNFLMQKFCFISWWPLLFLAISAIFICHYYFVLLSFLIKMFYFTWIENDSILIMLNYQFKRTFVLWHVLFDWLSSFSMTLCMIILRKCILGESHFVKTCIRLC